MGKFIVTFIVGSSIFVGSLLVCILSFFIQHEKYVESQKLKKQLEKDKKELLKQEILEELNLLK